MSMVQQIALAQLMLTKQESVDPSKSPSETFDLYSIPAYDTGSPEILPGAQIGSTKKLVEPDDVLLSRIVPHIRRSWIVRTKNRHRQIASGEWIVFRSEKFHPSYLRHVLMGNDFHVRFMTTVAGVGGSLLRARPNFVAKIEVPLPPLPEQRRIAAILNQAEALSAKRRQSLAQLDLLTQSIFFDMFGDPVANPKAWQRSPLSDVLDQIESGWSPTCLDRPATQNEWGVLKLGAVTWCEYDDSQQKALPPSVTPKIELEVRPGDLLFTRKNTYELVAACALVHQTRPNLMLPDLVFRLRLKANARLVPVYLQRLLITPSKRREIQKLAGGSAGSMPNISKSKLITTRIEVPPFSLQREFALRVAAVEKLKTAQCASLAKLDSLFASLQHRAFRGEL